MQQWSPFWRWLAAGVLAALTIAWLAQTESRGRDGSFEVRPQRAIVQHIGVMPGRPTDCAVANGASTMVMVATGNGSAAQQVCVTTPGMTVRVNGAGNVAVNGSATTPAQNPAMTAAMLRERGQLQRQEAELQAQQAQLNARTVAQQAQLTARMAALRARLSSLGH